MFPLAQAQVEIDESPAQLTIHISQKGIWELMAIILIWLVFAWIVIPIFIASVGSLFVLCIWYPVTTAMLLFPLYILLAFVGGSEKVEVEAGQLYLHETFAIIRRSKKQFSVKQIANLRRARPTTNEDFIEKIMRRWGMVEGQVAFDYNRLVNKFGKNLNDEQTALVLHALSEKMREQLPA